MAPDDFVMTLDSEGEVSPNAVKRSNKSSTKDADEPQLDPAFTFDMSGDPYADLLHGGANFVDVVKSGSKPVRSFDASTRSLYTCYVVRTQYPSMISLRGEVSAMLPGSANTTKTVIPQAMRATK